MTSEIIKWKKQEREREEWNRVVIMSASKVLIAEYRLIVCVVWCKLQ